MIKLQQRQSGFSVIEVLLIVIIVAILGFTGYFVYHARQATDKTLKQTNKAGQSTAVTTKSKAKTSSSVTSFAACKQAAGSVMTETFPEQCVTKDGQTFTDTSEAVAPPASTKAAADSPTPAAGTCETTTGTVVTVKLTEGTSDPRCSQVSASQTLSVVNPTSQTVTVTLGGKSVTIPAGKTGTIPTPFGDYLQTGDHVMQTGLYGDSGPEIYLPAS